MHRCEPLANAQQRTSKKWQHKKWKKLFRWFIVKNWSYLKPYLNQFLLFLFFIIVSCSIFYLFLAKRVFVEKRREKNWTTTEARKKLSEKWKNLTFSSYGSCEDYIPYYRSLGMIFGLGVKQWYTLSYFTWWTIKIA